MLRRVRVGRPLSKSSDARENLIGGVSPLERFLVDVMRIDEVSDAAFSRGMLGRMPTSV
jgi:hypothetical protein